MEDAKRRIDTTWIVGCGLAIICGTLTTPFNICLGIMNDRSHANDFLMTPLITYLAALPLCFLVTSPVAKLWSEHQPNHERLQWWMCLGGCIGPMKIAAMGLSKNYLTSVVLSMSHNSGMLVGCTLIDQVGFLGSPRKPVTWMKLCALVVFTTGSFFLTVKVEEEGEGFAMSSGIHLIISTVAGLVGPIQFALNRRAGAALPYPIQASGINYPVGFFAIAILWVILYLSYDGQMALSSPIPWYCYLLPPCFAFSIQLVAYTWAPKISFSLFIMFAFLADMCVSLLVSVLFEGKQITLFTAAGVVLSLCGTLLNAFSPTTDGRRIADVEKEKSNLSIA